ncbi:MAG: presenilin family intramembrane aspartyl protease [archaeon]
MKHTINVSLLLVLIFLAAQFMGLFIVSEYIDIDSTSETGKTVLNEELYVLEPPRVENESLSYIWIFAIIIFGTLLVLLLIRFRQRTMWKYWFLMSVVVSLTMAFVPIVTRMLNVFPQETLSAAPTIAFIVAILLGSWKVFRPNPFVHNFTEIFLYGGIAALLVPVINLASGIVLLLLISAYDMFAVWQSTHMVKMANFQTDSKLFAGLSIPYSKTAHKRVKHPKGLPAPPRPPKGMDAKVRTAILGGGDIAFPLLFSSAVMKHTGGFGAPFLVTIFAAGALFLLLYYSEKNKFYPAMPFISAGCFVGYFLSLLL